jgi:hypothetical protein
VIPVWLAVWLAALTLARWFTLAGLTLDILGVVVVGFFGDRLTQEHWRGDRRLFASRLHKWLYYGAWWAIIGGFVLQALGVVVQK